MAISKSQALNLSHQAQAVVLFLGLFLGAIYPTEIHAQTVSASRHVPTSSSPPLRYVALSDKPPPYGAGRVIGQIALGTASGVASSLVGGLLGFAITQSSCEQEYFCGANGALIGAGFGLVGGSAVGVLVVGYTRTTEIDFVPTLLGSAAGFGTSLLLINMVDVGNTETAIVLAIAVLLLGSSVGATLLGNTSRCYRAGHGPNGLLSWDDGQLHLGVPTLQQQPLGGVPQTVVRSVRLLEVRW